MINKFENFIFDLDGTIINSSIEVLNCFDYAFKKANYKINYERLTPNVIGPPLVDIVKTIAPDLNDKQKINEIISYYEEIYDYDENDVTTIYDGVLEIIKGLKKYNKKLFIATYKPTKPTMRLLKKFNLTMFDDVYTIDKFGKHITKTEMILDIIQKYNINKNQTVMIGDAKSDMLSAKEANIFALGVMWGYGTDKTGLINNSDKIINTTDDLKQYLL